ncbi:putative adaptor protein kanadaptin [Ostreococcus tauri]|uniref:Putative adaptor protein kanadaptin n=1 Tax=Ostreococcus tauri TaxID=70448 RepID=A0A1Y5HZQ6_OSTTA|nr:putative adaptor protein kanadaptin [Ostreococcus tauri]
MRPPPPRFNDAPSTTTCEDDDASGGRARDDADGFAAPEPRARASDERAPPLGKTYDEPSWGGTPSTEFFLDCLKGGTMLERAALGARADGTRGSWVSFGRHPSCDVVVEHPSTSRLHCVIQFKKDTTEVYVYDCGSAHGTFVNKRRVKPNVHAPVRVGDHIKLGESSRVYILDGDASLMPEEGLSAAEMKALAALERAAEEETKRELAKLKAEREAARAAEAAAKAGSSWGMMDADEEITERQRAFEELDWRLYDGKLSDRQSKQRDNIYRKEEKISSMRTEIDRIRAKETQQEGGLSAGQIQRASQLECAIEQLQEEIEDADEALNESLRVSLGLQIGTSAKRRRGQNSDDEDDGSDEDGFFDRSGTSARRKRRRDVKKNVSSSKGEPKTLETATTLWDKRIAIEASIAETEDLITVTEEAARAERQRTAGTSTDGDALDAYMDEIGASRFTAQAYKLRETLAEKVSELERISRLLKYADPTEEFRPGSAKGDTMRQRAEEAEAKRIEDVKRRAAELEAKRAEERTEREKREAESRRAAEWERQGNVQEKRKFNGAGERSADPERATKTIVEVDEDGPVVVETEPAPTEARARSPSPPRAPPHPPAPSVEGDDDDGFLMPDQLRAGLEIRKRPTVAPAERSEAELRAEADVQRLLAAGHPPSRDVDDARDDFQDVTALPITSDAQRALRERLGY